MAESAGDAGARQRGHAVNSTVTVTPSGGFTGTVAVTAATSVPGVTYTPSPLNIQRRQCFATEQLSCSVLATSTLERHSNAPRTQMLEKGDSS